MPGVGVDLGDVDGVGEVHEKATAIGVYVEEEILAGFIGIGGHPAIVELAEVTAGGIPFTINNADVRMSCGIAAGRSGDILELEARGGLFIVIMVDEGFNFAESRRARSQEGCNSEQ
jgi:hypothetical protein